MFNYIVLFCSVIFVCVVHSFSFINLQILDNALYQQQNVAEFGINSEFLILGTDLSSLWKAT